MNTVAIAGNPKRSSCRSSWCIRTLASTRGPDTGEEALSQPTAASAPSATSDSGPRILAMRSMVHSPREAGRLELRPAGGAPDAQLRAAEPRARKLDDDREHVGAREGVDAGTSERRGLTGDDLLELREVEEKRVVAHPGKHRHAAAGGDGRDFAVADADRGRFASLDDAARGAGHGRRGRAAEVHHLVSAGARHERLNHQ